MLLGLVAPATGSAVAPAVNPVLGALLYVTFLQVPARELVGAVRSGRFVAAVLVVNFAVVPLVVAAMTPLLPADAAVRLGVLLVLLAPCVDYVVVFTGLAGGSAGRLLALTPLLLLAQMALLPVFLLVLGGASAGMDPGPFLQALGLLIVLPLAAAWLTQALVGERVRAAIGTAMVPLMVATLVVVVASQVPALTTTVLGTVPFSVVFLLVMMPAGALVARLFRLGTADARAVAFTGATRNSLVVLPIALTLPEGAAAVVVAQTLVEVVGMVVAVRAVPRLVPEHGRVAASAARPRPSRSRRPRPGPGS
ncbi:arsenic resistance protein [Pseudonocardia xishanensis]|uniref:Arsenic resistance protein n=1 Tax=Pseudonocardia xishanensis TaxID=630995 RepID=A0ABP8RX53_9PSEU